MEPVTTSISIWKTSKERGKKKKIHPRTSLDRALQWIMRTRIKGLVIFGTERQSLKMAGFAGYRGKMIFILNVFKYNTIFLVHSAVYLFFKFHFWL
jgi:hypothetical protein